MHDQNRQTTALAFIAITALLSACSGRTATGDAGISDTHTDDVPGDSVTATDLAGIGGCDGKTSSMRQTTRALGTTAAKNGYLEYLPPACGGTEKPPLLVFWHGVGENGSGSATDFVKVGANGPPRLIRDNQWPAARPFIVLSPQHQTSGVLTAGFDCPLAPEIHDFVTYAITNYDIDPTRVYVTGLSCGAMGSANYLAQYDDPVAAAVLIAGRAGPMWMSKGCSLADALSLWVFHGDADSTVPIADDNTAMPQFMACPQPPRKDVRYVVYPGVGHDSWTRTYDLSAGHDIYSWLLEFQR